VSKTLSYVISLLDLISNSRKRRSLKPTGMCRLDHGSEKGGDLNVVLLQSLMNPKIIRLQIEASQVMLDDSCQGGH